MNQSLFSFLSESVSPWHTAQALTQKLTRAGFTELVETNSWKVEPGKGYFVCRGGSAVAAFITGTELNAGWKLAAAHTDSPGWRLKLGQQKAHASGVIRIGTEVYGSPIHSTWFDRPLAVAGRVFVKGAEGPQEILVRTDALGVFPNLAIHYNREINKGQAYDLAENLCFLAAVAEAPDLQSFLAQVAGFDRQDWLSADLFVVDPSSPTPLGSQGLFLSPRIDNLTGCDAVIEALLSQEKESCPHTRLAFCFDQEEIGSSTWTGADSSFLGDLMQRVHNLRGGTTEGWYRTKAASFILSVDAAHGVHPNWAGQHDEAYAPLLGKGPVLKSSARFSYATTAASEAVVRAAAAESGVPLQSYVMKSTLTPGSTVGPITTSWTGIPGADVGIPIWAMHSSQETADLRDQSAMTALVASVFRS